MWSIGWSSVTGKVIPSRIKPISIVWSIGWSSVTSKVIPSIFLNEYTLVIEIISFTINKAVTCDGYTITTKVEAFTVRIFDKLVGNHVPICFIKISKLATIIFDKATFNLNSLRIIELSIGLVLSFNLSQANIHNSVGEVAPLVTKLIITILIACPVPSEERTLTICIGNELIGYHIAVLLIEISYLTIFISNKITLDLNSLGIIVLGIGVGITLNFG